MIQGSRKRTQYMVGLDVGSTTVKAIVAESGSDKVVWQDYQRHETKQPVKVLEFLRRIEAEAGINPENTRAFITGSGGGTLAELIGAKFVQEVTAVSLAVEKMHPEVYSVIELGGQDAKIIVFKDDPESGRKKKIPSMNDKCAGGTGAVIDKINAKLKIPAETLSLQGYDGIKLHKVAGKCGVFAETDVNSLQKEGTPPDELMASLFEAIVLQNLSVLTRGHTLRPHVLLLGGPNTFIKGMREAWQVNIPRMWKDRKVEIPEGATPQQLIKVPQNAQYLAALEAVEYGKTEDDEVGRYRGMAKLVHYIDIGRSEEKAVSGGGGLVESESKLELFQQSYQRKKFVPAAFQQGTTVTGFVGVDGGSTSTKAVLLSESGEILCKAYQLSNGNPIQDTIDMFEKLRAQVESQGAKLDVLGVATTGYAKDILKDVLQPMSRWLRRWRTPSRRCSRAARSTTWRWSKRKSTLSAPASVPATVNPKSLCMNTAASPARSVRLWRRGVSIVTVRAPASSAWMQFATSRIELHATKILAAISARTTACERSSTSAQAMLQRTTSCRSAKLSSPRSRFRRASSA